MRINGINNDVNEYVMLLGNERFEKTIRLTGGESSKMAKDVARQIEDMRKMRICEDLTLSLFL